jgi:maltose-binding protein MalE
MRSKSLKFALVALVVVALVASCSPRPTATPTATPEPVVQTATPTHEPVTLTFWEYYGGATANFFDTEKPLFEERYPWITLDITHYTDAKSYREAVGLAFESDASPDAFVRPVGFMTLIENGWVQPLDPWMPADWKAKFPENSFSETRNMWQGQTYSFSAYMAPGFGRMIYINEDLFRTAGLVNDDGSLKVPKTWSELRSMAAQVTSLGNGEFYGMGIGIRDPKGMIWWVDLATLGGAFTTPYDFDMHTGQYVYSTNPAIAKVIELMLGLKADGSVYPYEGSIDDSNIYTYFAEGKFAMFMGTEGPSRALRVDYPDFQNYRIVPVPVPDEGQTGDMANTPGQAQYFISSQAKHPYEAWLWIDWLASRDTHVRMVQQGVGFSVYQDLNTPENITNPWEQQIYVAKTAFGVFGPWPPIRNPDTALVLPEPVTPDIQDVLIGIYTGQITDWHQALVELDAAKQAAFEAAIEAARADGADVSLDDFIFPDWDPMQNYVTVPEQ